MVKSPQIQKKMVEALKTFFNEKVDDLLGEIKESQVDLLEPVWQKFSELNLKFELKPVTTNDVLQIIKNFEKENLLRIWPNNSWG